MWAGGELVPRGWILLGRACLLDGVRARLRSNRTDLRSAGRDGPRRGRRGRASGAVAGTRGGLRRRFRRRTRALAAAPVSSPRTAAPPSATDAMRPESAIDASPPVAPNLVRPPDIPGARRVGRNTLEILLFRGLSTPLALGLVVLQSRFLEPSGRGAYVLAVLSVTILSRLLSQLGVAVTNRLREEAAETRPLVHRALALGVLGGTVGVALDGGVRAAVGAWTVANIITAGFALAATRNLWLPVEPPRLLDPSARLLVRLALTMGAVQVLNLVSYRIELFILERYDGLADVGIYSIAMQAAEGLWLISAAVAQAIIAPAVHETEAQAVRLVARAAVRGLLLTA